MFDFFRQRLRGKAHPPDFVRAYLDTPRPSRATYWKDLTYAVVDIETSGLDLKRDTLAAIGVAFIHAGRIDLARSWYSLLRAPDGAMARREAVRVHGLFQADLQDAPPIATVLQTLLGYLAGCVLVVHVAAIDIGFINRALKAHWGYPLHGPALDTARIARTIQHDERLLGGYDGPAPSLQLRALCEAMNLPVYTEHNALNDAVSTAQLFLAQATYLEHNYRRTTLGQLLKAGSCL